MAKGWALALLDDAPLYDAPGILTEPLTRDGPRVCAASLRALVDDSDLRRLEPGGALRPLVARVAEMTGSVGASGVSRAVDALHDVLWAALREELCAPEPELVSELAARLSHVCALIRDAALQRVGGGGEPELAAAPPPPGSVPGSEAAGQTPEPWGRPAPGATEPAGDGGGPLWVSALEEEVRQSGTSARPLALLLAELEDADRVAASASPERAGAAFGDFVAALRRALRRQDILVCESDARAWVIARETARAGAHSLGARIAEAVGEASLSGAPLVASVGVAVLGEDGVSPGELIAAAEEARFAASARGIDVSRRGR